MRLDGSVALVTGANRGIGAALVDALLARGASKVYAAARDPESVGRTSARVVPLRLDVTDEAQAAAAAAAARDVTVLVNNAGLGDATPLLGDSLDGPRAAMEVNYFGTWRVSRAFAPVLAANGGGALVNVLSAASWWAMDRAPGYSASKAAQWSLTNALRLGLKAQGTRVLGVHCGYVDTDFSAWTKAPKLTAREVAEGTVDAVEAGQDEAVLDGFSRAVKSALPGAVARLQALTPEDFPA
ncbi:SDR family oxidoreductase [Streptomyces sp. NPDC047002]|uniref:SDR family oxidoreductase n=1 Tax=Streptomyces sp. NPDC047002 TaxID=3155475 RepID=UPI0034532BB5